MSLSKIRIISGIWKGRKIEFPGDIVRPTGDRVRETVFNWLQFHTLQATCLDLFAGSGVFGFEALSRGAKEVVMIDQSTVVMKSLTANVQLLKAQHAQLILATVPTSQLAVQLSQQSFDLVFIDPPFHKGLVKESLLWLLDNVSLNKGAMIYIEAEKELTIDFIPECLSLYRDKVTGAVHYSLYQYNVLLRN